jgi:hypothetical protein
MDWKVDPTIVSRVRETVWDDFYENGGYGMYPTTLFGFVLVLTACLYLLRPQRRFVPIIVTSGCLTMASGVLGTATALMHVFRYVQYVDAADAVKVATLGGAEAITNLVLATVLVVLAGLAMLAGVLRTTFRAES